MSAEEGESKTNNTFAYIIFPKFLHLHKVTLFASF